MRLETSNSRRRRSSKQGNSKAAAHFPLGSCGSSPGAPCWTCSRAGTSTTTAQAREYTSRPAEVAGRGDTRGLGTHFITSPGADVAAPCRRHGPRQPLLHPYCRSRVPTQQSCCWSVTDSAPWLSSAGSTLWPHQHSPASPRPYFASCSCLPPTTHHAPHTPVKLAAVCACPQLGGRCTSIAVAALHRCLPLQTSRNVYHLLPLRCCSAASLLG